MNRQPKQPNSYEIIVYRTRCLVTDARGRFGFMRSFDNVVYDIFAVKNFAKNLNNAYSKRDIVAIINQVGVKPLTALLNERDLYNAMQELILVNCRIGELKRILNKQSKKSKRDKGLVREYNYLCELYKHSIKRIRHHFGIKNSKDAYKRRFRSLNRLVNEDDDYTSILMRDPFYDDDDEYEDDYDGYLNDYDYESSSSFEDLSYMINGGNPRKSRRRFRSEIDEFDEDEYDDDYDPYVRDMGIPGGEKPSNTDRKIDILAEAISGLQESIQNLNAEKEEDELTAFARKVNKSAKSPNDADLYTSIIPGLSENQGKLNHMIELLIDNQNKLESRQDDLVDCLSQIFKNWEDDDEDGDDDLPPFSIPQESSSVDDIEGEKITREELINAINGSDVSSEDPKK